MSTVTQPITAEQLLMMPDNHMRRELIAGEVREMPLEGLEHGFIAANFATSLALFVEKNELGFVLAGGTGFILSRNPDTVCAPTARLSAAIVSKQILWKTVTTLAAPDLTVEVISPWDKYLEAESKVEDWLTSRCRMVVVANPRNRTLKDYRKMTEVTVLTVDDTFDGGDVLPGFRIPVREIFGE